ncbi:MAG: DUF4160 domain-containing protein [bacterium]
MLEISRFFGIVIRMFFNDHDPPHFHAIYGDAEARIDITTLEVRRGALPRRALGMVIERASQHRHELHDDWDRARRGIQPYPIAPLD